MRVIAHKIGNKINGDGVQLFDEELQLDENMFELLQNYFLGAFKSGETFHFYSDSYLSQNITYTAVTNIFEDNTSFIESSKNIGEYLYNAAENPRVQSGELFIVFFPKEHDNDIDKIGIFKTENRESFLKIHPNTDTIDLESDQGISLTKIDKAAMIYNTEKENGYVLSVVDNNKNGDLYYWFEDFLKAKQRHDDYFHTQEILSICKDYIVKQLPQEYEISKADQADLMNKSINYFKTKEEFNLEDFTNEVLEDGSIIESFNNFKTDYEQDMQVSISESFGINNNAVKKSQRQFKSIIKLDKNFHIYVHGDRKLLQQDQDENGKFYKIYFENES